MENGVIDLSKKSAVKTGSKKKDLYVKGKKNALVEPLLELAKKEERASFELLINIFYQTKRAAEKNDPDLEKYQEQCKEVIPLFEKENGKILGRYICNDHRTAAVLTECVKKKRWSLNIFPERTYRFFTEYQLGNNPVLEGLLIRMERLAAESQRLLRGYDLEQCSRMIYSVAKKTLRLMDNEKSSISSVEVKQTVKTIEKQLTTAEKYHQRAARLTAQLDYLIGSVIGFVFLVILLWSAVQFLSEQTLLAAAFGESHGGSGDSTGAGGTARGMLGQGFLAGGVGAIISVMARMSFNQMKLDYEAAKRSLRVLGSLRPIIGAVFALVIIILLNSTLLDSFLNIPGDQTAVQLFYLYLIIGFLAGFSERLAPDMLQNVTDRLSNGSSKSSS